MNFSGLVHDLLYPLIKLIVSVSLGLLVGNLIEAMNWTRAAAKLAAPLVRIGRMQDVVGASFSLAFFSNISANTMLAEAYDQNKITRKELILANLFNSLPTYFLHLPTMFFITAPFIKEAAFVYVGLTVFAAFLRTAFILVISRLTGPPLAEGCVPCRLEEASPASFRDALKLTWKRFRKRIKKIVLITLPIYIFFYILNKTGVFAAGEKYLADSVGWMKFLPPEAISIVIFHVVAEFNAGMAAAGAVLQSGALTPVQIVTALLIGNILSTPMRAVRHQYPYYAGIFSPGLAWELILHNQLLRAASLILVTAGYLIFVGMAA